MNKEILEKIKLYIEKDYSILENGDLSDLGNIVGIAIGPYINEEMGYELESFYSGVDHGVDLAINHNEYVRRLNDEEG